MKLRSVVAKVVEIRSGETLTRPIRNRRSAVRLRGIRVLVAAVLGLCVGVGFLPDVAIADIDVESIEFFKGLDRQSGTIPPNQAYFVELCLIGTDITSASVRLPDKTICAMGGISGDEYCCEENFDTQQELDNKYPTGPGQNYTVNILGTGGPDSAIVEFNVEAPTTYPDITSPAPGAIINTDVDLVVSWTLIDAGSCNLVIPDDCADGIAVFVSTTMGPDEDVYAKTDIAIADGMVIVPAGSLDPDTPYRIEVETARGSLEENATTDALSDSYLLTILVEDINSIGVPEPTSQKSQAAALAVLLGMAWSRRRRP